MLAAFAIPSLGGGESVGDQVAEAGPHHPGSMVFADGSLPAKTKQLIAVAAARHSVPVLHQRAQQARPPGRRE